MASKEAHTETRRMMETAVRRLNVLEYLILAMAMALAAGVLTAWILRSETGASFRISWIVASLLFFLVPGFLVLRRERRSEVSHDTEGPEYGSATKSDDG